MKTIFILNKTWKVKDLQMIGLTKSIKDLVNEYKKDPNCLPYDWISSEPLSDLDKASFIYSCKNK